MIYPIPNFRQWPDIGDSKSIATTPPYRKQLDRPKKARKRPMRWEKKESGVILEGSIGN